MKRRRSRIESVLVGNARVTIYRRNSSAAGHKYLTYDVCDYTSGRRQSRDFADHQAARKEARRIVGWLAKNDAVGAWRRQCRAGRGQLCSLHRTAAQR